jgi:hypothetical protein
MSRAVGDSLLSMLEQSFMPAPDAGPTDGWHSLLANLENVRDEDWEWLPADGRRSIAHLALHCGFAMRMYADYGFGPGTLQTGNAVLRSPNGMPSKADVIEWLKESYSLLRDGVDSVTDADLSDVVKTHWGEPKMRRWFAVTIIEHNIYHAGEINHIRALAQGNDAWPDYS